MHFQVTKLEDWAQSDEYHNSFLIREDATLEHALQTSVQNDLPDRAVTAAQGKYLKLLIQSLGAKRILEVGTLGGYSTIWLAQGLPDDGELITLELSEKFAQVAQENIDHAALSSKVKIVIGDATQTMKELGPAESFDLAFIDADKPNNLTYFQESKRLVKKGGVIIVDNVVRNGKVADPTYSDEPVEGIRKLLKNLKGDTSVDATTIGTVGEKGYDGFLYAINL
ncbi:hypothetical protein SERLA73DRAFT_178203 [Serpula lacrymans var. lacrymans S7.3]|uniref:O-methyltransferase family 3 protein n=2 Tax=Serpula lacrymans var. lacrymans TaxID=341189 RepID=F8PQX7_SERL3|nr:uncharacterized protein SERLADRAFT_462507 [Serpula lacrymans var. lacrymans S7.9]EGO02321.1 hypothetical protein SERLA73DRAFT_178203 [Serpula lacrymans var. lacrymans S7.3]EGO28058.1 hypothetical protein SERLADRAFT_462507 [Serpula lacrymans var. lacrymans S7.9]